METLCNLLKQDKSISPSTSQAYAKVAIDLPLKSNGPDFYYYNIPEELKNEVKTGSIVLVPFGKQEVIAFVIEITNQSLEGINIKPIFEVINNKSLWDENFIKFATWLSKYYLTNIGTVLSGSITSDVLNFSTKIEVELTGSPIANGVSKEQKLIVDKLTNSKNKTLSYRFLKQKTKLNKSRFYQIINQLKDKTIIRTKHESLKKTSKRTRNKVQITPFSNKFSPSPSNLLPPILNKDQENAFNVILEAIKGNKAKTFLLHGVTGSGKTEVYLRLIEEVLKNNKNVIYLVPEIYLLPQVYQRIISRFPNFSNTDIVIWHSSLSKNERLRSFEMLQSLKPKIVLGARSALLIPVSNIGLIVIDEAHESAYKQGSPAPRYDAIKAAVKRSEIEDCQLILGTATPNITTYHEALKNKTLLELPKRIEDVPMPDVNIIDLRTENIKNKKSVISNKLENAIREALNKNEQIILLLNRRGYASHIFCKACGFIQYCKNCSVPLTFHKLNNLMICHHCGYSKVFEDRNYANANLCPNCKTPHLKHFGLGTQQLEEEVKNMFRGKGIRTIRVDSDSLRKKDEYIKLWEDFSSHKADILIGTQLVAKGLDLPNVTVVGVVLADTMLNFPDYISHEKAFQLLIQVTGRAGRGVKKGNVFIQTYLGENILFNFIKEHDYKSFYDYEIKQREEFLYPPFISLSRIIFQSYDEKDCIEYANEIMSLLHKMKRELDFLGPAPCFFSKLHGKYRYHILCKSKDEDAQNVLLSDFLQRTKKNDKVETIIDVDSVNLL